MYARTVENKELTLTVSGYLWNSSLVMLDLETKSYWSHLLGEAKAGPLEGKSLEQIPSLMTDWATFKREHPDGTVAILSPTVNEYNNSIFDVMLDLYVFGIVHEGKAYAWTMYYLDRESIVQQKLNKVDVVIFYDPKHYTARMFQRRINNSSLDFLINDDGKIRDKQTGSEWNRVTGKAISGKHVGKYLEPMPAIMSFQKAWMVFHPESKLTDIH